MKYPLLIIIQVLVLLVLRIQGQDQGHNTISKLSLSSADNALETCSEDADGNILSDCSKLKPSTYAVPVDQLKNALRRPILAPDGEIIPPWMNVTQYNAGVEFSKKNFFAIFLMPIACITLFTSNPLVTPLIMATGKSSTVEASAKRYLATILQMKIWYEHFLKSNSSADDEEMNPQVLQSLHNVRGIHFMLIRNYTWSTLRKPKEKTFDINTEIWDAFLQDLKESVIPQEYREWPDFMQNIDFDKAPPPLLNQLSLSITQFLLGPIAIMMPEKSGIIGATDEELMGFMHFWAVLGHALGIEDQFNVALQPNLKVAREYYREMYNKYMLPSLFNFNDEEKIMYEVFIKGLIKVVFGDEGESYMSVQQLMIMSFEDVLSIPCPKLRATMPISQRILRTTAMEYTIMLMRQSSWARDFINNKFISLYCENGAKAYFGVDAKNTVEVVKKCYS